MPDRFRAAFAAITAVACALTLGACTKGSFDTATKFKPSEFGVAASPRVVNWGKIPKGGGRYSSPKPYKVAGKWYEPIRDPRGYEATGTASWYGPNFHGRLTANGEVFDRAGLSAAHPTLPLPSYVRVTNTSNGHSVVVRVNDRGPYMSSRMIDLSERAAGILGFQNAGTARVHIEFMGMAPLEGDDTRKLLATVEGIRGDVRYAYAGVASGPDALLTAQALAGRGAGADGELVPAHFSLGTFVDPDQATNIAARFAVLAAVELREVVTSGGTALEPVVSGLRGGVTEKDIADLAAELSITDIFVH